MPLIQTREDKIHKIEVHVAPICIQNFEEPKILIAKRNAFRTLFPNLWECGGGQVHTHETFEEALKRQVQEEFHLEVDIIGIINTYVIETDQNKIPGIKFLCVPSPSTQEVILNPKEHSEVKWVTMNELNSFNFIPGIQEDIQRATRLFKEKYSLK
ncbi:MAG TPA: NUDIX domain-containing protein, partial [Gammaproteobacteria bacterium]|nr:NUDIX domain-containing protein [Gammaproteobacteria bacterium]